MAAIPIRDISGENLTPNGTELIVVDNGVSMRKAVLNDAVAPKVAAEIANLNLGTAAQADTSDFATAEQGTTADTAVQPGDLAAVATTGAYSDLSGTPALGSIASEDASDFLDQATFNPTSQSADVFDSANHTYDNSASGLSATDVQGAIDEVAASSGNGGTMTGLLTLAPSDDDPDGTASLNIPAGADTPDVQANGDLWADSGEDLRYRRGGTDATIYDSVNLLAMGQAEAEAGTVTTARTVSAAVMKAAIVANAPVLLKTSDQSFATQTLGDVTGLAFTVGANEVWAFEAEVLFEKTVDNNAYPDIAVNGPAGANIHGGLHINMDQASDLFGANAPITAFDQRPFTFALNGAVPGSAHLWGYIAVGATAGTVTIRGARNGTAGTATIKDGSILKAYRIS